MRLWQYECSCVGVDAGQQVHLCNVCGGAIRGPQRVVEDRGKCRWCAAATETECTGCGRGIHYHGTCRLWNRGANRVYSGGPDCDRPLCPDCFWQWVVALGATRSVGPLPQIAVDVERQLNHVAAHMSRGAGINSAQPASTRRPIRQVRRWLVRHLRGGAWAAFEVLCGELRQNLGAETVTLEWSRSLLQEVVDNMQRGDALVCV